MKAVSLAGRLGQPIELKTVGANETSLAEFDIGVKGYDFKAKEAKSDWIRIVVWGKDAEYIATASVGDGIIVNGTLETDSYDSTKYFDSDGKAAVIKKTFVKAALGGIEIYRKGEGGTAPAPSSRKAPSEPPAGLDFGDEDDIPF